MHMYNDYIRRDAYPHLPGTFDDPQEALRVGLQDGVLLVCDADAAVKAIDEEVAKGVSDITFLTFQPGEDVDEVSRRIQYLSDHVLPRVRPVEGTHERFTAYPRRPVRGR